MPSYLKTTAPSGGFGTVFKVIKKTLTGSVSQSVPSQVQPTIVGGAPNLQDLLTQVSTSSNENKRIEAAERIRQSIDVYSVSSIPEIWYTVKDMVAYDGKEDSSNRRKTGLKLMITCIQRDEYTSGSRMAYYYSIVNNFNVDDFDLQLRALKELTGNGRSMDDLFFTAKRIPSVLIEWFQKLAEQPESNKKLHDLLVYIKDSFTQNSIFFDRTDIINLITMTIETAQNRLTIYHRHTSARDIDDTQIDSIIRDCLEILELITTHAFIPSHTLPQLVNMLCLVPEPSSLSGQVWKLVDKLSRGYISHNFFIGLCNVLKSPKDSKPYILQTSAFYLQCLVQLYVAEKRDSDLLIIDVMEAYNLSIDSKSLNPELDFFIVSCLYNLLKDPNTREQFTYDIWESEEYSPLTLIERICRRFKQTDITTSSQKLRGALGQIFKLIAEFYSKNNFLGPREAIIEFYISIADCVDESCALTVIEHTKNFQYCNPLSPDWVTKTNQLLDHFFDPSKWGFAVRSAVLDLIQDIFSLADDSSEDEMKALIKKIFHNLIDEPDSEVFVKKVKLFELICMDASISIFIFISDLILYIYKLHQYNSELNTNSYGSMYNVGDNELESDVTDERKKLIVRTFCTIFASTFCDNPSKAKITYTNLMRIIKLTSNDPRPYIEAARLLSRLRASADDFIFISTPLNMDGLSASVGRNLFGVPDAEKYKLTMLWWYPETVSYLNETNLEIASNVLKTQPPDVKDEDNTLDISLWFDEILRVIQYGAPWEIYSFIWAHLGPQLANIQFFRGTANKIQKLRVTICDQIVDSKKIPSVKFPSDVSRSDIKVTFIRTTSSLLSYHDSFSKQDEDYIVSSFVDGFSSSEKAIVPCIHGLTVSCYELPLSVKKFISKIFIILQARISNSTISPHILEFLVTLARLPSLTDNLNFDEVKIVFGIAIRYINDAIELSKQERPAEPTLPVMGPTVGSIQNTINSSDSKLLSQYLLVLAYNVIATWFLALPISQRKHMASFIIKPLRSILASSDMLKAQTLACLDMIYRFTYSNLDLTLHTTRRGPAPKKLTTIQRWIYGSSIVSIETDTKTGETQIIIRRPSGTAIFNLQMDPSAIPSWVEENIKKIKSYPPDALPDIYPNITDAFTPSDILLRLMVPVDTTSEVKPIKIPDDPALLRTINTVFDLTSVVDNHSVGVIYIAPGQRHEEEILRNSVGSAHYNRFLKGLGKLVKLKGNHKIYRGGLNNVDDTDGEYAYFWSDKITQMIYHVTTMIPNNPNDPQFTNKKRHIGNDFINIFFDESEIPFEFGLVKSQFNFVNISITPMSCTFSSSGAFIESDNLELRKDKETRMFYKVRAICKPGLPSIFAACHLKIVSEDSLPSFIRNLSIVSSKFAAVWSRRNTSISSWQLRLEHINQLRENVAKSKQNSLQANPQTTPQQPQPQQTVEKKEDSTVTSSILNQLSDELSRSTADFEKEEELFVMDQPEKDDDHLKLLKDLDFFSFT